MEEEEGGEEWIRREEVRLREGRWMGRRVRSGPGISIKLVKYRNVFVPTRVN